MFAIRKLLSPREGVPTNMRFVPGVGVQVTPDEGETWNNDPASDPRGNPAYALPSAEFDECSIAAGMVEGLQQFVIQMITTTTVGELATAATALLGDYLPALAWAYPLSTDVAEQTMTLGQIAIDEAMTLDVYDALQCALFCNMPDTKIMTEEAWSAALAEAAPDLDTVSTAVLGIWHELLGVIGITNAGLLNNDPDANCEDCQCCEQADWDHVFDFTIDTQGFIPVTGSYLLGDGFIYGPGDGYWRLYMGATFGCPCPATIEGIEVIFGGEQTFSRVIQTFVSPGGTPVGYVDGSNTQGVSPFGGPVELELSGGQSVGFTLLMDNPTNAGFVVTSFHVWGSGTEPDWSFA